MLCPPSLRSTNSRGLQSFSWKEEKRSLCKTIAPPYPHQTVIWFVLLFTPVDQHPFNFWENENAKAGLYFFILNILDWECWAGLSKEQLRTTITYHFQGSHDFLSALELLLWQESCSSEWETHYLPNNNNSNDDDDDDKSNNKLT